MTNQNNNVVVAKTLIRKKSYVGEYGEITKEQFNEEANIRRPGMKDSITSRKGIIKKTTFLN